MARKLAFIISDRPTCASCRRHPWIGIRLTLADDVTEVERTAWSCLRHVLRTRKLLKARIVAANARVADLRRRLAAMGDITD